MGNFYVTATVADVHPPSIAAEVRSIDAYVGPTDGRYTVIYPDMMQVLDPRFGQAWAQLSKDLATTLIVTAVYDDDVFEYQLWEKGKRLDHYASDPEGIPTALASPEQHARRLCVAFGCTSEERVKTILGASPEAYTLETDRHRDLVDSLGLPKSSVGIGFTYIEQGELPEGVSPDQLRRLPADVE